MKANHRTVIHDSLTDGIVFNDGLQDVTVLAPEKYVFNLGNIFFVDRVLFTQTSDILTVLQKYESEHQSDVQDDDPDSDDVASTTIRVEDATTEKPEESQSQGIENDRDNRKEVSQEQLLDSMILDSEIIPFPEDWENYEQKVLFINNQKVSILRQKSPSDPERESR
jgi:hypothetical protein